MTATTPPGALETVAHGLVLYRFWGSRFGVDDFAVVRFEAIEELDRPYRLTLELERLNDALDPESLLGMDASFAMVRDESERTMHGIVARYEVRDPRSPQRVVVELAPALTACSFTTTTRIFQGITAIDIVEQVLGQDLATYGRTVDRTGLDLSAYEIRDYCVQYRETNLDLIHRLLEEEGVGYYFAHHAESETIVLFDGNRGLPRLDTGLEGLMRFEELGGELGNPDALIRFSRSRQLRTGSVIVRDHDWTQGRATLERTTEAASAPTAIGHRYSHGIDAPLAIHEDAAILAVSTLLAHAALIPAAFPDSYAQEAEHLRGAVLPPWSRSDLSRQTQIRGEEVARDAALFHGESHATAFHPGARFEVAPSRSHDVHGEYFVTRVTHRGTTATPRSDRATHGVNYENHFDALPFSTTWRPLRRTPRPRIDGVQTARVVGPVGLEIHTDAHGRIKVQFTWDRAEFDPASNYSCWLRVSQVWAGMGAPGFSFIPRVGMEVIVTFVDGNPDRPLVIGCVPNATNVTPNLLPVQATKSTIRTSTVPHSGGYNEISFEDAMGLERVHIRAQRDLDEVVLNDHRTAVSRDRESFIHRDRRDVVMRHSHAEVHGHATTKVSGRQSVSVLSDQRVSIGGDATTRCHGNMETSVSDGWMLLNVREGALTALATGDLELIQNEERFVRLSSTDDDDRGVRIESKGAFIHVDEDCIELSCGGSVIRMSEAGITVNRKSFPK